MAERYSASVTLHLEVTDERALWERARGHYEEETGTCDGADLDDIFGDGKDEDFPYDISACLRQLADPGESWPGTSIQDSSTELDN